MLRPGERANIIYVDFRGRARKNENFGGGKIKNGKKILSLALAVMLLLACGCGGKSGSSGAPSTAAESGAEYSGPTTTTVTSDDPVSKLGRTQNTPAFGTHHETKAKKTMADGPKAVLAAMEYVPEILYGSYSPETENLPDGMPLCVRFERCSYDGELTPGFTFSFPGKYSPDSVYGAFEVYGNTLLLYPLTEMESCRQDGVYVNCVYGDEIMEYGVTLTATGLILSSDGYDIIYGPSLFSTYGSKVVDAHDLECSADSKSIDSVNLLSAPGYDAYAGFDKFELTAMGWLNAFGEEEEPKKELKSLKFETTGELTVVWGDEQGVEHTDVMAARIYSFFWSEGSGFLEVDKLFFTDGSSVYAYVNDRTYDKMLLEMSRVLPAEIAVQMNAPDSTVKEEQVEELVVMLDSILLDLKEAYAQAGIPVTVDENTGEITLDSAVLFASDSYELTPEGKELLKDFFTVYVQVVSKAEYVDYLSAIVVEGHTDTTGSYEYNMTLSENRAQAALDYCMSEECGAENAAMLEGIISAKGCSFDSPVYNGDGSVNMEASRRVNFRFYIAPKE